MSLSTLMWTQCLLVATQVMPSRIINQTFGGTNSATPYSKFEAIAFYRRKVVIGYAS